MAHVCLQGKPVQLIGTFPKVGDGAAPLRGVDMNLKDRSLDEFLGERKLVCFVPSLDTPVCMTSAHKFSTTSLGRVIYCSMDLPFVFKRACHDLKTVTLLSLFRTPEVAKAYGVLIGEGPLAGLCARAVIVLDQNNQVVYTELVDEIGQEPDYDKALEALNK